MSETGPVLEARGVKVHFTASSGGQRRTIRAVDGVDLALHPGEVIALVGESGSGKTTMARVFARVYQPTSGEVLYQGQPLRHGRRAEKRYFKDVQLIFQDPFASLNALKKVSYIIGRAISIHKMARGAKAVRALTLDLLRRVHMTPPEMYADRYPTDMSGGQRQRIAMARSLAMEPKVILADEPTSMLDASIRLGVLNLLDDLRREREIAVLYITHDIASARYLSDRIYVMYGGVVVESGDTEDVVDDPAHPYTKLLLSAAPDPARYKGSGKSIAVDIADANPVDNTIVHQGCRFADRCPFVMDRCRHEVPPTFTAGGRSTLCWLAEDDPRFSRRPGADGAPTDSLTPDNSKETDI